MRARALPSPLAVRLRARAAAASEFLFCSSGPAPVPPRPRRRRAHVLASAALFRECGACATCPNSSRPADDDNNKRAELKLAAPLLMIRLKMNRRIRAYQDSSSEIGAREAS